MGEKNQKNQKNDTIILFYPKTGQDKRLSISPPHALLAIAAPLIKEYKIILIDERVEKNWKKKLIKEIKKKTLCVGISSMIGSQIKHALNAAETIRKIDEDIPIIWGGIHTTTLPEQSIKDERIDFIVKNEGEETFKELIENINTLEIHSKKFNSNIINKLKKIKGICFKAKDKIYNTPQRPFLDINKLLPTPWQLIDIEKYIHSESLIDLEMNQKLRFLDIGATSRGCTRGCKFCYNTNFYNKTWRAMSVEKTLKIFIDAVNRFKLDGVWLRDDNFFLNPKRTKKFAELLIEAQKKKEIPKIKWYSSGIDIKTFHILGAETLNLLQKSGCNSFRFGIESGNQRILNFIGKGFTIEEILSANRWLKKNKITPHFAFMGGFPTETYQELMDTINLIDFIKKENKNARLHQLSIFNPIPGTELFKIAIKYGFKPYQNLEEYANKSHFFSKDLSNFKYLKYSPKILNNISDMSYLINDYIEFAFPPKIRKSIILVKKYFLNKWKKRQFKHRPELFLYRTIRNHILEI